METSDFAIRLCFVALLLSHNLARGNCPRRCGCLIVTDSGGNSKSLLYGYFNERKVTYDLPFRSWLLDCRNVSMDRAGFEFELNVILREKVFSSIDLSDNPIRRLSEKMFYKNALQNTAYLSVARSEITSIEPGVFSEVEKLEIVDLSGNKFALYHLEEALAKCHVCQQTLKYLDVHDNWSENRSLEGGDLMDREFSALKVLNISNTSFSSEQINRTFSSFTSPNLDLVDMSSIGLTHFPTSLSKAASRLQEIKLSHNFLARLDTSLFNFTSFSRLRYLDLTDNRMYVIDSSSYFLPPSTVHIVDLSHNNFGPEAPSVERVHTLVLSGNRNIERIPRRYAESLPDLRELVLDGCSVTALASDQFGSRSNITKVALRGNSVRSLASDSLIGLNELTYLDLGGNTGLLKGVDLTRSSGLKAMTHLTLSDAKISSIRSGSFGGLPNLISIDLDGNSLHTLGFFSTSHFLRNLTHITASRNKLLTVRYSDFSNHIPSVISVSLNYNSIYRLEEGALLGLPNLQSLQMSHNQLISLHLAFFLTSNNLLVLDLSYNNIHEVVAPPTDSSTGDTPPVFQQLEKLELSHNHLESIDGLVHQHFPKLQYLLLASNYLRTIPFCLFPLVRLKLFDFSNNRFLCTCETAWVRHLDDYLPKVNHTLCYYPQISRHHEETSKDFPVPLCSYPDRLYFGDCRGDFRASTEGLIVVLGSSIFFIVILIAVSYLYEKGCFLGRRKGSQSSLASYASYGGSIMSGQSIGRLTSQQQIIPLERKTGIYGGGSLLRSSRSGLTLEENYLLKQSSGINNQQYSVYQGDKIEYGYSGLAPPVEIQSATSESNDSASEAGSLSKKKKHKQKESGKAKPEDIKKEDWREKYRFGKNLRAQTRDPGMLRVEALTGSYAASALPREADENTRRGSTKEHNKRGVRGKPEASVDPEGYVDSLREQEAVYSEDRSTGNESTDSKKQKETGNRKKVKTRKAKPAKESSKPPDDLNSQTSNNTVSTEASYVSASHVVGGGSGGSAPASPRPKEGEDGDRKKGRKSNESGESAASYDSATTTASRDSVDDYVFEKPSGKGGTR